MNDAPVPAPTPVIFAVKYESAVRYNRDLKNSGELTVTGDKFDFSGHQRGVPFPRGLYHHILWREQIRNVTVTGNEVQFITPVGNSGEKKMPFVFYCESPEAAQAAAALLPAEKDAAYVEAADFNARLNALAPTVGPAGWVTNWIIAANVAMFVYMGSLGAGWLDTANMRPYLDFAANNGAATTQGEWWRLVTSMFAHYGVLHLALNMWALFQVGHLVEKLFGRRVFALIYFGAGIIGGLTTLLWHGDKIWSAGASGAVFGVYGALLGYLWREKHGMPRAVLQPLMKSTVTFAGYNLVYGAIYPRIDNAAHLGGLAGGILLGWLCALPVDREIRGRETPRRLLLGSGALALAVAFGIAAAPRFAYSIHDELRWEDTIKPIAKEEDAMLKKGLPLLQNADGPGGDMAARSWLTQEAIPAYERWIGDLGRMPLEPGLATAKRRDALVKIMQLQLFDYRSLVTAANWSDPEFEKGHAARIREINATTERLKTAK